MSNSPLSSINGIIQVAQQLSSLLDQVVFVGGSVTGLLLTDPAAPEARVTEDIDVILSAVSQSDYYDWEGKLESLGLKRRRWEGDPLCRWTAGSAVVDIMPLQGEILGFSNRWYPAVMRTAITIAVTSELQIKVVTAPYFVATKVEAFRHRGSGDYLSSRDVQDIVSVVDGRPELVEEVNTSDDQLQLYLADAFRTFLNDADFLEALPSHLLPDAASQRRAPIIEDRCRRLAGLP